MSGGDRGILDRAAALRDAFDRMFAEPHPSDPPPSEDLLAIRMGAEPYALRLSEITGLFADRKITPIPARTPALLGVAGFRGAVVPVYDLSSLLGCRTAGATRWLVTAAMAAVAFAFTTHESHLRVARHSIARAPADERPRRFIFDFAHTPDLVRPIVHLPSVIDAIGRPVAAGRDSEEP